MALAVASLLHAASTTDATDYTTASITPTANRLVVACYSVRRGDSTEPVDPTDVTGNGLTYTQITSHYYTTTGTVRRKQWVFAADSGGSPSAGGITFNHPSGTHLHGTWGIYEVNGSDVASGVAQCFIGIVKSTIDTTGSSVSLTLAAASNADNRPFHYHNHGGDALTTPRASWTEIGDATTGENHTHETQWRSDAFETAASASWTGTYPIGSIAWEMKAAQAATISWSVGHINVGF